MKRHQEARKKKNNQQVRKNMTERNHAKCTKLQRTEAKFLPFDI